jgi:hypothetical protein
MRFLTNAKLPENEPYLEFKDIFDLSTNCVLQQPRNVLSFWFLFSLLHVSEHGKVIENFEMMRILILFFQLPAVQRTVGHNE